jgi:hypothetical protein
MLAVELMRQYGIGASMTANKVVGRCLGERDDGGCFFASVDLPWVISPKFNWFKIARRRLDTFLSPDCTCRSGKNETAWCKWHMTKIIPKWQEEDAKRTVISKEEINVKPLPGARPGPMDLMRRLHNDYPWVKLDVKTGEWVCIMCDAREQAMDNGSWRNVFVRRHSHCGFGYAAGKDEMQAGGGATCYCGAPMEQKTWAVWSPGRGQVPVNGMSCTNPACKFFMHDVEDSADISQRLVFDMEKGKISVDTPEFRAMDKTISGQQYPGKSPEKALPEPKVESGQS